MTFAEHIAAALALLAVESHPEAVELVAEHLARHEARTPQVEMKFSGELKDGR